VSFGQSLAQPNESLGIGSRAMLTPNTIARFTVALALAVCVSIYALYLAALAVLGHKTDVREVENHNVTTAARIIFAEHAQVLRFCPTDEVKRTLGRDCFLQSRAHRFHFRQSAQAHCALDPTKELPNVFHHLAYPFNDFPISSPFTSRRTRLPS